MTEKRNIPLALPTTGEQEWQAVRESIMTGWLTQGPKVAAFEKAFAERHNARHAIAASNCTTGLHLILAALGVAPGDEVIVPSFTWISTANAVLYCGATPVFVDIDRATFDMDPSLAAAKVTARTKAIMPVHLFGLAADIDAIAAAAPGVAIVEDAACASGASYKGRHVGTLGLAGAFSFHPRKSVTTGEGGMVITNDDELAERVNSLRNHGASISEEQRHSGPRPYLLPEFNMLGYNYRMTDLQGAIGVVQLSRLDKLIAERRKWAKYYDCKLADIEWLRTPVVPENRGPGWQSYVTYVDESKAPMPRNEIMEHLQSKGISTRPGTHAVHMQRYYQDRFGLKDDDFPVSRDCDRYTMAIPLHNRMTADDFEYVVQALKKLDHN